MGVGRRAELGGAAAEDLGLGEELGVHLQPYDRFVFHRGFLNLTGVAD
jgi:hypothetical protein